MDTVTIALGIKFGFGFAIGMALWSLLLSIARWVLAKLK